MMTWGSMLKRVACVVGACVLVSACVYRSTSRTVAERKPSSSDVRLRTSGLPGRGDVQPSGSVTFAIDLERLCQRFDLSSEITTVIRGNKLTKWYWIYLGAAVATAGVGGLLMADAETKNDTEFIVGVTGLALGGVAGLLYGIEVPILGAIERPEKPSEPRIVSEPTADTRCTDGAGPAGTLELATPWGAVVKATPAPDGTATFAIDWSDDRATEAQAEAAWRVSSKSGLATTWTASDAGRRVAIAQIAKTRDRIVTGSTPAALVANLVASTILVGGTSQLALRVENRGGSTAVAVTAKTRSSVAALHGLVFDFGKIHPNKTVVRSVPVKVPATTTGDSATVLVTFEERAGNVPAELTEKLPLTRSLCPEGKLTRAQYDDRRKKLEQGLASRTLSQEDFDKYDAELLRCLE
jgi:hypothetical protein